MNAPAYQALSPREVEQLLAPGNDDVERAWSRLRSALHGVVAMLSVTYPRPLYHYEDSARADLVQQLERLRATPFYDAAAHNVGSAEEIERMFREHGHTPELHATVDRYLDALLNEFEAGRLGPDHADNETGLPGQQRAVAGR